MNIDQCNAIISEVFEPAWPQIAPGGSKPWTDYFVRDVVYPVVRCFPEPVARQAAHELVRERNFPPPMNEWAKVAGGMYATENREMRTECLDCGSTGLISVAVKCNPILGERDWANMRHPLDDAACGPGWYTFAIPCNCENAVRQADTDRTRKALTALRQFEATFKRSDWADARKIVMGLREGTTPETRHEKVEHLFDAPQEMPPVAAVADGDEIPF